MNYFIQYCQAGIVEWLSSSLGTIISRKDNQRPFGYIEFDRIYSKTACDQLVELFESLDETPSFYVNRWDQFYFSSELFKQYVASGNKCNLPLSEAIADYAGFKEDIVSELLAK